MRQEFIEKSASLIFSPNKNDLESLKDLEGDYFKNKEVLYLTRINDVRERTFHIFILYKDIKVIRSTHWSIHNCIKTGSYSTSTIEEYRDLIKKNTQEYIGFFDKAFVEIDYWNLNNEISEKEEIKIKNKKNKI